jgi:hypothetical protein
MRVFLVSVLLLGASTMVGCGSSAQGPAKPEDTPVVSQEEIRESYTKGMPPEVKKMYEAKMKQGGS